MMNSNRSRTSTPKIKPVGSTTNLRKRVERLLSQVPRNLKSRNQLGLDLNETFRDEETLRLPTTSIIEFLDFLTDSLPDGDIYLFGGVLRDLAILGGRGFSSDIDIVVEGNWESCMQYLEHLGADKNKFGGYRLEVASWKVDIWNAKETWAIAQGLVPYKGISSLTETTVLNWDAVLMNWRRRTFIFSERYLDDIQNRRLDIVLEHNPNPAGMAMRAFRHLCLKEALSITPKAITYLANSTASFSLKELTDREIRSYGKSIINPAMYRYFEHIKENEHLEMGERLKISGERTRLDAGEIPFIS